MTVKKIDFEVKDLSRVEMPLEDFKWLITELYFACSAVGNINGAGTISRAERVLNVIYQNNLNLLVGVDKDD